MKISVLRYFLFLLLILFPPLFFSSCLTCEKKEYTIEFTGKGSGKLTIIFYNIMSVKENGKVMTEKDFTELTSEYIEGKKIKEQYPNGNLRTCKLFEKDGVLCGKVIIYFEKPEDIKLYQYQGKGPYMMYINTMSEFYYNSNGTFMGKELPVVFWDKNLKTLTLTTTIEKPDEETISLVEEFRKWQKK
ncbi:MAG: hypothetical protein GX437_12150 [Sphingobacteriales bacterium]|nr:hypothetical protein [Sphingobacteriales bacterium]